MFIKRDPAGARGTKSVAHRRGKSSMTSQFPSSVSLLFGVRAESILLRLFGLRVEKEGFSGLGWVEGDKVSHDELNGSCDWRDEGLSMKALREWALVETLLRLGGDC